MTARFGRNKRRRAREAIAALASERDSLLALRVDDARRLHNVTRQLIDAHEEIRLAKAIAGPASMLFPAKDRKHHELESPMFWDTEGHSRLSLRDLKDMSIGSAHTHTFTRMRLPTLVAKVSRDWLDKSIHARLTFDGMPIAYAVDPENLTLMREADLAAFILRETTPLMVQALADGIVARRQGRPPLYDPSMNFKPRRRW